MPAKPLDIEVQPDLDFDIDDIDFPVVDDVQAEYEDVRDYTDRCFENFSPETGASKKAVRRIVCHTNDEPEIANGEIAAIFNYKAQPAKGRKNPLAGYDVLHVSLPTGDLRVPLDQAEKFGRYLIGAARSVIKQVEADTQSHTNDNVEK